MNFHHYPRGGGYQAEHIDPHGKYAPIQTIVQASIPGVDFKTGGLFARESADLAPQFVDPQTSLGDLIVLSPAIQHGVGIVDEGEEFDWNKIDGRWIIMPIMLWSDYPHPENVKPFEVKKSPDLK